MLASWWSAQGFEVRPGGVLEVLGGLCNQPPRAFGDKHNSDLAFRIRDGHVSMVLSSNGQRRFTDDKAFIRVLEDTKDDQIKVVTWDQLLPRVAWLLRIRRRRMRSAFLGCTGGAVDRCSRPACRACGRRLDTVVRSRRFGWMWGCSGS